MPDPISHETHEEIRTQLARCPDLHPRATSRGAIYLEGGPFDPEDAAAMVEFIRNARRYMAFLLGLVEGAGPLQLARQHALLKKVAVAYESWEADMLLDSEAWHGGLADLPTLTWPLWDRLQEIQRMRNEALGRFGK